jgi:hypothetical protein
VQNWGAKTSAHFGAILCLTLEKKSLGNERLHRKHHEKSCDGCGKTVEFHK